jgi:hypothetical protein
MTERAQRYRRELRQGRWGYRSAGPRRLLTALVMSDPLVRTLGGWSPG